MAISHSPHKFSKRIYVDQGVNRKELSKLASVFPLEIVHVGHYEQRLNYADTIPGVFVLNVSSLNGGDYLAGDDIIEVENVMQPQKQSDRFDIAHVYSAYHDGCHFFITNNPKDFIREIRNDPSSNGRREKLEGILEGMKIMTLDELSTELNSTIGKNEPNQIV